MAPGLYMAPSGPAESPLSPSMSIHDFRQSIEFLPLVHVFGSAGGSSFSRFFTLFIPGPQRFAGLNKPPKQRMEGSSPRGRSFSLQTGSIEEN